MLKGILFISSIIVINGCVGTYKVADDAPSRGIHSEMSKVNHNTIIKNSKKKSKIENNTTKKNLLKK